jgi:hypothetical protein
MAITFDNSASGSGYGSSLMYSHTIANQSNRTLFVGVEVGSSATPNRVSGISYAGTPLSLYSRVVQSVPVDLWYLNNPATGANNIVINLSGTNWIVSSAVSYNGVNQSSFGSSNSGTAAFATQSISLNLTTTQSNSVILSHCGASVNEASVSGTSATQRVQTTLTGQSDILADKTASTVGTYTIGFSGGFANWGEQLIELLPASTITSKNTQAVCFW